MQARGIFLTVLSAVLYGLNPLFSKTINVGGCNSLTQTFARLAAGIVIFFILLVCSGSGSVREKLRLSRQELKDILICCIGYLREQVTLLRPKLIVCLGRIAAMRLIREDFKITREHGQWVKKGGFELMAMYHPAALLRDPARRPDAFEDLMSLREKARAVCEHTPLPEKL